MANLLSQERASVRITCRELRKLLAAEKLSDVTTILQDVRNIESDALTALGDEFRDVKRCLNELLRSLRELGIIDAQNWDHSPGKPESGRG